MNKAKKLTGNHDLKEIAPGVSLACMSTKARDLMDQALDGYEAHCKRMREWKPKHRSTIYSFAYWLFRWSGIVDANGKVGR